MHKGFTQIQASWIWVSSANVPFGVKAKARSLQQGKLAETNSYRNRTFECHGLPWYPLDSIGIIGYHRQLSVVFLFLPLKAALVVFRQFSALWGFGIVGPGIVGLRYHVHCGPFQGTIMPVGFGWGMYEYHTCCPYMREHICIHTHIYIHT